MTLVLPAPILDENVHLGKLLLDSIWVGRVSVHFVDGENHWDFRGLGVVDGLLGLGHDPVVGRHDDDGQICDLCTPRTHRGERLVTWRVQEGHFLAAFQLNRVSTDVLGDASCLTSDDVGFAHKVKQRGFAMVDVSHHGHNRWARNQIVVCILLDHNGFLNFSAHKLNLKTKFFGDDGDGFRVQTLVDGHHDAQGHASRNDVVDAFVHHGRQFGHRDEFRQLQDAFFELRLQVAFVLTLLDGVTLLTAQFG